VLVDPGLTLANGSTRPNSIFARTARFGYAPIFDPFARQANIDQQQAIETTNAGTPWKQIGTNPFTAKVLTMSSV
jgi:hypothetical protein